MVLYLPFLEVTGGTLRGKEGFFFLVTEVLKKHSHPLWKESVKSSFKNVFPHKSGTGRDAEVLS